MTKAIFKKIEFDSGLDGVALPWAWDPVSMTPSAFQLVFGLYGLASCYICQLRCGLAHNGSTIKKKVFKRLREREK